jgi:alpha-galactosidase/6-phospho-beta-glucosidase family protein
MCGGIFQDHDVMYMSINHGKFINDFREHGRVAMRESLHKHRRGDEWTN